jgi:ferredoxin-thioredoxin reductase catalytic subunit
MTRADLEKLTSLDFWEEDSKSVIITPCFYRDDDRGEFWREVFSTPYLMVFLKKEGEIDLLTPYLEKYKLKIARDWSSDPRMRFLCSLYVTPESEKSPIEIANEMFESGDFAGSRPSFAYPASGAD